MEFVNQKLKITDERVRYECPSGNPFSWNKTTLLDSFVELGDNKQWLELLLAWLRRFRRGHSDQRHVLSELCEDPNVVPHSVIDLISEEPPKEPEGSRMDARISKTLIKWKIKIWI